MQLHLTNTRLHINGAVSGLSFNCWPISLSFINWNVLSTQSCSIIMLSIAYTAASISMVRLFEKLHHLFYIICYLCLEIDLVSFKQLLKILFFSHILRFCGRKIVFANVFEPLFQHFSSWPLFKILLVKNFVGIVRLSNSLFCSPLLSSGI